MQIITDNLKVKEISDEQFELIYNNSGILDAKIKGFIRFTEDKEITLHQIYVHPEHRREGIGTKMLKALKKKKIVTFSNTSEGEPFFGFLIRHGFKNVGNKTWEL